MTEKPEEQEPWWKRQERESREKLRKVNEEENDKRKSTASTDFKHFMLGVIGLAVLTLFLLNIAHNTQNIGFEIDKFLAGLKNLFDGEKHISEVKTCEELSPRVIKMSKENENRLLGKILKMSNIQKNNQQNDFIHDCVADALWSRGNIDPKVRFALKQDKDGDYILRYKPILNYEKLLKSVLEGTNR